MAWIIGWDLILEYAVGAGAVAIGWSGYIVDFLKSTFGIVFPTALTESPFAGGIVDLPAVIIILLVTCLLVLGTSKSTLVNNVIVIIKLAVIAFFLIVGFGYVNPANWHPFLPFGVGGIFQGASIIFFAYIGFDQISTSAEETKNPAKRPADWYLCEFVDLYCPLYRGNCRPDWNGLLHKTECGLPSIARPYPGWLECRWIDHLSWSYLRIDDCTDCASVWAEPHLFLHGT